MKNCPLILSFDPRQTKLEHVRMRLTDGEEAAARTRMQLQQEAQGYATDASRLKSSVQELAEVCRAARPHRLVFGLLGRSSRPSARMRRVITLLYLRRPSSTRRSWPRCATSAPRSLCFRQHNGEEPRVRFIGTRINPRNASSSRTRCA
jgi:hypothetical protein